MKTFRPRPGSTVEIDVAASSDSVALSARDGDRSVRVRNASSGEVFFDFGGSDASVSETGSMSMDAGGIETFEIPAGATHVAALGDGSGKFYITLGTGL